MLFVCPEGAFSGERGEVFFSLRSVVGELMGRKFCWNRGSRADLNLNYIRGCEYLCGIKSFLG